MLGRLARWLRILGYDTVYERAMPDEVMIDRVMRENRWLLTRDRYLAKRRVLHGRHTLLASDALADQLRQLRRELQIDLTVGDTTASRCPICNLVLEAIPREKAAPLVPVVVASQHEGFARCSGCGRIYWSGTHWTNLLRQLELLRGT